MSFRRILLEDLTNDVRFRELHRAWLATKYGMTGEHRELQFYAARETALRKGRHKRSPIRNVPGFFRWMICADPDNLEDQKERLGRISQRDEDVARRKLSAIAGLRAGKARRSTPPERRCIVYERGGRVFVGTAANNDTDVNATESRAEVQRLIRQSLETSGAASCVAGLARDNELGSRRTRSSGSSG